MVLNLPLNFVWAPVSRFLLFRPHIFHRLPICFAGPLKFFFKLQEVIDIRELGTKFFTCWAPIREIKGCPGPCFAVGFHLLEVAENALCLGIVVDQAFVGFLCPHEDPDQSRFHVVVKLEFPDSS